MDLKVFYGKNINIFKYSELDEITNPNSSAIVDINGDCKSDLVFTVYNSYEKRIGLEIWLNKIIDGKSFYVKYSQDYLLPPNSLQVLFGDFNGDGSIDLVVPTCVKSSFCNYCCVSDDKIYFIPNIQKRFVIVLGKNQMKQNVDQHQIFVQKVILNFNKI